MHAAVHTQLDATIPQTNGEEHRGAGHGHVRCDRCQNWYPQHQINMHGIGMTDRYECCCLECKPPVADDGK